MIYRECIVKGKWLKCYSKRRLMGKLALLDLNEPGAYISHFNVKESHRNNGHGYFILETAIAFAKLKGCTAISLHCSISNVKALRLYQRYGFFIAATTQRPRLSYETGIVECNYFLCKQI